MYKNCIYAHIFAHSHCHRRLMFAIFWFRPLTLVHNLGILRAPYCCVFLIRFTARFIQSFSLDNFKKFLPMTVTSDFIAEHTQALFSPKSTPIITCSVIFLSLISTTSSKAKSKYQFFPLLANIPCDFYFCVLVNFSLT